MFKSRLHFWTFEILMIFIIIFLATKISFVFHPIVVFFTTLFFPILVSGFLFYLFSPIIYFMERRKISRTIAIIIIYILVITLISIGIGFIVPLVGNQIKDIIKNVPFYIGELRVQFNNLSDARWLNWMIEQEYISIEKIESYLLNIMESLPNEITASFARILNIVTNITLIIITVPFILFYMFKDGHKFPNLLVKLLPTTYRNQGMELIKDTNETLQTYIQGQILVCLFVGVASYIGYLIIGVPYALTLGIVIAITNIIPYVGPFIGAAPAVIIGLFSSPTTALLVVIVVVIVQQLDGNLLSPYILGKRLNTHPLTIIIVLLVAGNLAGIFGMILAVPVYATSKTVILNIIKFVKLRRNMNEDAKIK